MIVYAFGLAIAALLAVALVRLRARHDGDRSVERRLRKSEYAPLIHNIWWH